MSGICSSWRNRKSSVLRTARWANELRIALPPPRQLIDVAGERYGTLRDGQNHSAAAASLHEKALESLSQQQQSTAQSLHELHGLVATQSDALRGLVAAQSDALRDLSDVQICSIQEMLLDVVRKGRDVHRNRTRSVIKMDFLFQIPESLSGNITPDCTAFSTLAGSRRGAGRRAPSD